MYIFFYIPKLVLLLFFHWFIKTHMLCNIPRNINKIYLNDSGLFNRVGGKRSSFLPTFVFRPLTPPYVPFGIRRFFTMDAFRILRKTLPRHHLQPSICRSALLYTLRIPSYLFKGSPILLSWFYAFIPTNGSFQCCRLNKVRSFPIGIHALGTTTSADFSRQALLHHGTSNDSSSPYVRETSSDKGINFPSYVCSIYTNRSE